MDKYNLIVNSINYLTDDSTKLKELFACLAHQLNVHVHWREEFIFLMNKILEAERRTNEWYVFKSDEEYRRKYLQELENKEMGLQEQSLVPKSGENSGDRGPPFNEMLHEGNFN